MFRWVGGRPIRGMFPVVVVFSSKKQLEKLWSRLKGNLRGDIAYQFYGLIQIYPGAGVDFQPAKLQEQFGTKIVSKIFSRTSSNIFLHFSSYVCSTGGHNFWEEEKS